MQTGNIMRQWTQEDYGKFNRGVSENRNLFCLTLTIKIIINGFGVYAILFMLQVNFFFYGYF